MALNKLLDQIPDTVQKLPIIFVWSIPEAAALRYRRAGEQLYQVQKVTEEMPKHAITQYVRSMSEARLWGIHNFTEPATVVRGRRGHGVDDQ